MHARLEFRMSFAAALSVLAIVALGPSVDTAPALAAASPQDEGSVFLPQTSDGQAPQDMPTAGSKVYFPDAITPESVAEARARAAEQERLEAQREAAAATQEDMQQIAGDADRDTSLPQLTDGSVRRVLGQLSEAEREVVLEAITGTDICDDPPAVDAIRKLCESRIETRSQDFAVESANPLTPEERLLGEGLEDTGRPDLAAIIERLARDAGRPDDPDNQAIASVALQQQESVQQDAAATEGSDQLNIETQQFINALVQQIGSGGSQ